MNLLLALLLVTQGAAPLRKSDLVRLPSASAMSSVELAQFVGRNCLTFEPTERDRTDFRRLGADRALLDAVDRCARRTTIPPVVAPPRPQPVPARRAVSPVRSAFATGGGQRRSEEHTSELQSQSNLVCRLLLEKKKGKLHRVAHHCICCAGCSD